MSLPCPNCGADLRFIEDYGRQYCDACGQYAPEGYGSGKGLACPKCGGVLSYIPDYDRYFCYKDQEYAPDDYGKEPAPPPEDSVDLPQFDELLPPEPETTPPESPPPRAATPPPEAPAPAFVPPEVAPEPPSSPPNAPAENVPEQAPPTVPVEPSPEPAPTVVPISTDVIPPSTPASGRRKDTGVRVIEAGAIREAKREAARPLLLREEIVRAKKAALMDLANAYDLESIGTKEELKERLLGEIDRRDEQERRTREETEKAAAEASASQPAPLASAEDVKASIEVNEPTVEPASAAPAEPAGSDASGPTEMAPSDPTPAYEPPATEEVRPPVHEAAPNVPSWMVEPAQEAPSQTKPSEAVLTPAAVPEGPKVINPCPTCGRELSYLDQYDRYYCYNCKAYAPPVVRVEAVPAPPRIGKPCPTCGRELTFIPDYNRHYCYNCKKYAPLEGRPAESATPAPAAAPSVEVVPPKPQPAPVPAPPPAMEIVAVKNPCPTCGRELSYVEKYGRFYCYSCKKYAPPKPRHPCPNCGMELTYIAQYGRHYCPSCGQYAPKELTAQILAARSLAVSAAMAAGARPAAATITRTVSVPVHHHASPSGGVALTAVGLLVLLLYGVLWAIPFALNGHAYFSVGSDQATNGLGAVVQVIGFLLLGLGAIVGLVRLRTMR